MFSISAINDTNTRGKREPLAPTKEAQEFHLTQTYHEGLLRLQDKDYAKAREYLELVLRDPLLSSSRVDNSFGDGHLLQLRFLSLKNLATVFLEQGSDHYKNALHCYLQAVEIDSNDSVVWNQLGTLACTMGLLSTSRWAFEQGLLCSPNNWNCMEKLLEVLIAIGDEVSCLSVADLILRHWPSHSRAMHVKETIKDADPISFAPRGIDKLEPRHLKLKFPKKRKEIDEVIDNTTVRKRCKKHVELLLVEPTWKTIVDSILHYIFETEAGAVERLSCLGSNELTAAADGAEREKTSFTDQILDKGIPRFQPYENIARFSDLKIELRLLSNSAATEANRQSLCSVNTNACLASQDSEKATMMKENESSPHKEHSQERRSSRLERLRSRKSGKEELELAYSKYIGRAVFKFLEPFVLKKAEAQSHDDCASRCTLLPNNLTYTTFHECSDVKKFVSKASNNNGAYHIGHMLLEEVACIDIPYQDSFLKFLELEKLTRYWGDRTPLCSLFLAELYYDQGLCSSEAQQSQLFSEASYHLCKVIELIVLDAADASADMCHHGSNLSTGDEMRCITRTEMQIDQTSSSECIHPVNGQNLNNAVVEDSLSQEYAEEKSTVSVDNSFLIRFFWLSGCLSLSSNCKEKAFKEFCSCLSILKDITESNKSPAVLFLSHCRNVGQLTADRLIHQINLLRLHCLVAGATNGMIEKGMYKECIDLLSPLLLSTTDVYQDVVSLASRENERVSSVELSALDALIFASEKVKPMNIDIFFRSHHRKLQVLAATAGMTDTSLLHNSSPLLKKTMADSGHVEQPDTYWIHMVSGEIKEISQCASQMKYSVNHSGTGDGCNSLPCAIGDIQSLLLTIMTKAVRMIANQKLHGSESLNQTEDLENWFLVDAAITFCKLQHLATCVSIKNQVDLIVATHELLAEYGLCCAGRNTEGDNGTFLKFAIKHLLALEMILKSSEGKLDSETKHHDGSAIQIDTESMFPNDTMLSVSNTAMHENEVMDCQQNNASVDPASESVLACDEQNNPVEGMENEHKDSDVKFNLSKKSGENDVIYNAGNPTLDAEAGKVELCIENALDQSFFCLYGLNINPDPSSEDDLSIHKNTNSGDYQTKEQCADVFQYILPYANVLSRAGLVKLRRVLRAIRKHFPQPPDEILLENAIDKYLDGHDLCEDELSGLSGPQGNQEVVLRILFAHGCSTDTYKTVPMRSGPYIEVYDNLYYLIAQAEEISALERYPGFVLKKEGEEFVQQNANLFKYDLLFNPLRFESWQKLANIFDEEVDLLLNDGSKHISVVDWRKSTSLPLRVQTGRRRSKRCLLMSLALAKTSIQQSQIHELLALVYYDNIQNVVPFYDQRSIFPRKDAAWLSCCKKSMNHFEKAIALKSEWLYAFYLGKLCEKIGHSPDKVFAYYGKAAALSPSAVDPFYRIHASRMKILYTQGKQNLDILKVIVAYCYNNSTKEAVMDMFKWNSKDLLRPILDAPDASVQDDAKTAAMDTAWNLLYNDCLSALEVCVEGELKHFHKARYKLAKGLYRRGANGDLERAKDELSFCFKSSRSTFTVNMWEIDGITRKGRKKHTGLGGSKSLEVALSESSRKFITCIRKYILFYLNLLEKTKDSCMLERAYVYLRTDKRFSLCLGDIVPIALAKCAHVLTKSIRNAESHGVDDDSSSLEQLLEKLFSIFMDHIIMCPDICSLPEVNDPDLSESNLSGFIHMYIHLLESDMRLDTLEGVNEKIRKRFKNPKLASSNFAGVCKHAYLAWYRCILVKLSLITPLPSTEHSGDQSVGRENSILLFLDLELDELLSTSVDSNSHTKGIDMNWYEALSRIKNIHVRQAADDNIEAAISLMRSAYGLFRESSSVILPSGLKLYTISSSKVIPGIEPDRGGCDTLDLSVPRKLLLWSYTLIHGRCLSISSVVRYCEEHMKSRMRRQLAAASHAQAACPNIQASVASCVNQTAGSNEAEYTSHTNIPIVFVNEVGCTSGSNLTSAAGEFERSLDAALQLKKCSTMKETSKVQESKE